MCVVVVDVGVVMVLLNTQVCIGARISSSSLVSSVVLEVRDPPVPPLLCRLGVTPAAAAAAKAAALRRSNSKGLA